jgi:hypothetical protein
LLPPEQEIMCSEYMRLPEAAECGLPQLAYLLARPGETMKDIDILGISTNGRPILAQVAYVSHGSGKFNEKLAKLRAYQERDQAQLVFFCNCPERTKDGGVIVMPLQKVFDSMRKHDSFRALFNGPFRLA